MGRHGIHPWEKIAAESGREATFRNFDVPLVPKEDGLVVISWSGARGIKHGGVTIFEGVCPGPETFSQTGTHRVDEQGIRVVGEEIVEEIDINGSYDLEEGRIVVQSAEGDGIVEF